MWCWERGHTENVQGLCARYPKSNKGPESTPEEKPDETREVIQVYKGREPSCTVPRTPLLHTEHLTPSVGVTLSHGRRQPTTLAKFASDGGLAVGAAVCDGSTRDYGPAMGL